MKRYKSRYKNLTLHSNQGTIQFEKGVFTAAFGWQEKAIEKTKMFKKGDITAEEVYKTPENIETPEIPENTPDKHVCAVCGEEFTTKQGLNSHSRVHK
jgi:hypothetical protein